MGCGVLKVVVLHCVTNAEELCKHLGVTLKKIDITKAVKQHFNDIGHAITDYDVTFENSQARERTQVLMDISNQENGIVVGTGDLSELALGWATYNGDHMTVDVCSNCHPFYTGKQKILDTGGRVARFEKRYGKKAK